MTENVLKSAVQKEIEEVWNKGNLSLLDELYSEEMIYHIPPYSEIVGLETYKEFVNYTRKRNAGFKLIVQEIVIEGNSVLVSLKHERIHEVGPRDTNMPITHKKTKYAGHVFFYISGGKPVEMWNYVD
jgi:predicted ester cyclase